MGGLLNLSLVRRLCLAAGVLLCASCAEAPVEPSAGATAPEPVARAPQPTLEPLPLTTIGEGAAAAAGPRTRIFPGNDAAAVPHPARPAASAGQEAGDIVLDFVDVDVKDVVRAVLGDILHVSYAVDPAVAGRVTLQVTRPIARDSVLPALEAALKVNGVAIVQANGLYSIVPIGEAQRRAGGLGDAEMPGYGVEVAPLRYIAAAEMQKLLEPFAPPGGIMRVDPARNMLFLVGTAQDRQAMRDTIATFDVDWLAGMSYALVRPRNVDAASLATELKAVFADTGSPIAGLVRFIPVTRLNTLLVASPRRSYLDDVNTWVERLDVPVVLPGKKIYYYRLQNAKAADVAAALNGLFKTSAAGGMPAGASAAPDSAATPSLSIPTVPGLSASPGLPMPDISGTDTVSGLSTASTGQAEAAAQIVTDEANNALIIRIDPSEYPSIEAVIQAMDVEPDQVLIQVTIAEVSLTGELRYGVEWFFANHNLSLGLSEASKVASTFPGFNFSYFAGSTQVVLSALDSVTNVNVISSPKLLTLDNKPATLQVGDQVPVVTQTSTSVATADAPLVSVVEMRDTGVLLTVTPRIAKSGLVVLNVAQEVSDAVKTTTSGIDSPTIQRRRLQTTVGVHDGETVALGGLMRRAQTNGNQGIPLAKDIPILGSLFGTTTDDTKKTELLVFLTPRVIRSAAAARDATAELRRGLDDLEPMIRHGIDVTGQDNSR